MARGCPSSGLIEDLFWFFGITLAVREGRQGVVVAVGTVAEWRRARLGSGGDALADGAVRARGTGRALGGAGEAAPGRVVGGVEDAVVAVLAGAAASGAVAALAGVADARGDECAGEADRVRAGDAVVGARVPGDVRVVVARRRARAGDVRPAPRADAGRARRGARRARQALCVGAGHAVVGA